MGSQEKRQIYAANVKDKVKALESKSSIPVEEFPSFPRNKNIKKNESTHNVSSKISLEEPSKEQKRSWEPLQSQMQSSSSFSSQTLEAPATLDIESVQVDSSGHVIESSNLKEDSCLDSGIETEEGPVSVKNLLQKFSSGVAQTFKKKGAGSSSSSNSSERQIYYNQNQPKVGIQEETSCEKTSNKFPSRQTFFANRKTAYETPGSEDVKTTDKTQLRSCNSKEKEMSSSIKDVKTFKAKVINSTKFIRLKSRIQTNSEYSKEPTEQVQPKVNVCEPKAVDDSTKETDCNKTTVNDSSPVKKLNQNHSPEKPGLLFGELMSNASIKRGSFDAKPSFAFGKRGSVTLPPPKESSQEKKTEKNLETPASKKVIAVSKNLSNFSDNTDDENENSWSSSLGSFSDENKTTTQNKSLVIQAEKSLQDSTEQDNNGSFQEQLTIVVMGTQNSGKSTIVNCLARQQLSPVHQVPLSTPELIECCCQKYPNSNKHGIRILDLPGWGFDVIPGSVDEMEVALFSELLNYLQKQKTSQISLQCLLMVVLRVESIEAQLHQHQQQGHQTEAIKKLLRLSEYLHEHELSMASTLFVLTSSDHLDDLTKGRIIEDFLHYVANHASFSDTHATIFNIPQASSSSGNQFHEYNNNNTHNGNWTNSKNCHSSSSSCSTDRTNLLEMLQNCCKNEMESDAIAHFFMTDDDLNEPFKNCFVSSRTPIPITSQFDPARINLLKSIYSNPIIQQTDISSLLNIGWENVSLDIRRKYPEALRSLQLALQRRQIKKYSDLPDHPMKLLELLNQLPTHNPAIADLLTETCQLKVPCCYAAMTIGQGYDISNDCPATASPFQFSGQLKTSLVGLIPEEIDCRIVDERDIVFKFFTSYEDFVMERFKDLGISHAVLPKDSYLTPSVQQRAGYNVIRPNQELSKITTATARVEYRLFHLQLASQQSIQFKSQFWELLQALPELDIKNSPTVDSWKDFFRHWGTHVIQGAYGGGSIHVNFRGDILSSIYRNLQSESETIMSGDEFDTSQVFGWITGDGLDVAASEMHRQQQIRQFDADTCFQGGDMKFLGVDLMKLAFGKVSSMRNEWIQSLPLNPIILETNVWLVPISQFVRELDENLAYKMDSAFLYFYSTFVGAPKQSSCTLL